VFLQEEDRFSVINRVDEIIPVRMAAKRRTGYRALGYTVE
jgi:hypothetical protein